MKFKFFFWEIYDKKVFLDEMLCKKLFFTMAIVDRYKNDPISMTKDDSITIRQTWFKGGFGSRKS